MKDYLTYNDICMFHAKAAIREFRRRGIIASYMPTDKILRIYFEPKDKDFVIQVVNDIKLTVYH